MYCVNKVTTGCFDADHLASPVLVLQRSQSTSGNSEPPDTPSAVIALWKEFKDLFNKRTLRIDSDSVGYGFVLRGEAPTYVQMVDPTGPAAQAGLRVGHIVQMVNNVDVLHMSHKETANIILAQRLSTVTVTVLEPADFKDL